MKLHRVLFPPSPSSSYPLPYFLKSFNKGARTGLTSCRCNMVNYSGWCVTIRRRLTGEDDIQLELGVFWNIHISSRNLGTQLFKNEVVRLILICFGWKVSPYLELQRKWYRQGREWGRIRVSSSNDTVTSIESSVKMATRDQRTRWWKNRNTWIWKKKSPKTGETWTQPYRMHLAITKEVSYVVSLGSQKHRRHAWKGTRRNSYTS